MERGEREGSESWQQMLPGCLQTEQFPQPSLLRGGFVSMSWNLGEMCPY